MWNLNKQQSGREIIEQVVETNINKVPLNTADSYSNMDTNFDYLLSNLHVCYKNI